MYYRTTREMWVDLEERFGQPSAVQLYSLQELLSRIQQGGDMSVAKYNTKVKAVWDELDN